MKHQRLLTIGLVISAVVNIIGFLVGCGGGTASTGGGGNPVPTITAISPTSVLGGSAAGFALTINGANFMSASMVNFGGTTATATFVSSTQLTAAIPATAITSAGNAAVLVTNPPPGGGTSNMVNFTINAESLGAFTPIVNMTKARADHTATLLPNGKVLIAGGSDGSQPLASAELYDSSAGVFAPTGSMTADRTWHTATLLANGKVLIAGGSDRLDSFQPLASAELYDPSTGMFTLTGSMTTVQRSGPATLLQDGRAFVAGETNAEIYDPASETFAPTGAYVDAIPVLWNTVSLLADGRILLTGCAVQCTIGATELFDPKSGTFSRTGPMKGWANVNTATLLKNGKVLLVGNAENDGLPADAEVYDPAAGTFTFIGNSVAPHEFAAGVRLADGTVLITGGQLPGGNGSAGSDLYLPASDTFAFAGNMTTARHEHTATLLNDGTVLIVGGYSVWPTPTASAEIYKPATSGPQAAPARN